MHRGTLRSATPRGCPCGPPIRGGSPALFRMSGEAIRYQLPEAPCDVSLCSRIPRRIEEIGGRRELHQLAMAPPGAHGPEGWGGGAASCLLHVVPDEDDGVVPGQRDHQGL